jgi:diaminopimelate epimerase
VTRELYRLSGAGNDFLALVEPAASPTPEQMRAWCRRGVSLGADGVFVLRRDGDAIGMDYFNADGGVAELCVNATRCAVRLAHRLGWTAGATRLRTPAGEVRGRLLADGEVEVEVPLPAGPPQPVTIAAGELALRGWYLTVGVPHAVIPWPGELADCDLARLGPPVRHHGAFPAGANANFVRYDGEHEVQIRTWERGVEAETLACGTGVLAAAAVGVAALQLGLPVTARTRGGFTLVVDGEVTEGIVRRWSLRGDARLLARAEVFAAAEEQPR